MKAMNHSVPVYHHFGISGSTKGEVGIELEVIGSGLPSAFQKTTAWQQKVDGSVKVRKGEVAFEYVMKQPVGRVKFISTVKELLEEFQAVKAKVAEGRISNSNHVHINAQQLTLQQVYTWLSVYFIFEELLCRWAGEDRVSNLFCLRARDAEGLILMLRKAASEDAFSGFTQAKQYRYSAVNVTSLSKFGSLEFRALRGTCDVEVIENWVNTLLCIKDKSLEYKNPVHVLEDFSRRSPIGFIRHIIPEGLRNFMYHQTDFQDVMYEGARLVQDFAFATKWQDEPFKVPEKPKLKAQPFSEMTTDGGLGVSTFTPGDWDLQNGGTITSAPAPATSNVVALNLNMNFIAWVEPGTGSSMYLYNPVHHFGGQWNAHVFKLKQATISNYITTPGRYVGFKDVGHGLKKLAILQEGTNQVLIWMTKNNVEEVH
jgi:hypothetical protein